MRLIHAARNAISSRKWLEKIGASTATSRVIVMVMYAIRMTMRPVEAVMMVMPKICGNGRDVTADTKVAPRWIYLVLSFCSNGAYRWVR